MSDGTVTLRISQKHATFLQANLSALATVTRQAMSRPGLEASRRSVLGGRAVLLETIEDAVRGALMEVPQAAPKNGRSPAIATKIEKQPPSRNFGVLSAA